jgi:hypothetical protein
MAASFETIDAIYRVIRKHCTDEQVQRIIADLQEVPGNKSRALERALKAAADKGRARDDWTVRT